MGRRPSKQSSGDAKLPSGSENSQNPEYDAHTKLPNAMANMARLIVRLAGAVSMTAKDGSRGTHLIMGGDECMSSTICGIAGMNDPRTKTVRLQRRMVAFMTSDSRGTIPAHDTRARIARFRAGEKRLYRAACLSAGFCDRRGVSSLGGA